MKERTFNIENQTDMDELPEEAQRIVGATFGIMECLQDKGYRNQEILSIAASMLGNILLDMHRANIITAEDGKRLLFRTIEAFLQGCNTSEGKKR